MPTFESRADVISKLVSPERSANALGWNAWRWESLVRELDEVGLVIVKKPTLLNVGRPNPRPYV